MTMAIGTRTVFVTLCLYILIPLQLARAGCYAGSVPNYNDITAVEIVRCQSADKNGACYYAEFAPTQYGYLIAHQLNSLRGTYTISSTEAWRQVISALQDANFVTLRVPQARPGVLHLNGARDQITIQQCNTHFAIAPWNYDSKSTGYQTFMALFERLTRLIGTLRWRRESERANIEDVYRHFWP